MKRKGVAYCPLIMRYATVKGELAQDRCLVTYNTSLYTVSLERIYPLQGIVSAVINSIEDLLQIYKVCPIKSTLFLY